MASVVAGSGLGLFNSVAAGAMALGHGREQVYVNAATGNLVVQNTDDSVVGKGTAFGLVRTYNSSAGYDGDNNDKWRMGHISSVVLEGTANTTGSRVRRIDSDGFEQIFDWNGSQYVSKAGTGAFDTLTWSASGAVVTFDNGVVETFNAAGNLIKRADLDGEIRIDYNAQNKASSVILKKTDGTEDISTFVYNGNGLLTGLRTSAANGSVQLVTYEYDASNRLSKVRVDLTPTNTADAVFYDTTFTYVGTTTQLETISQSDGSKVTFTYDGNGRVKTMTDALGRASQIDYVTADQTRVTVAGEVTDYYFDAAEQLLRTERTVGFEKLTTAYTYNADGKLLTVTDPEGGKVSFGYDSKGNLTSQTDALNNTRTRTFNTQNQLLTDTFDGATERYVYDANGLTLRFKLAADGSVTEYRYTAAGLLSESRQYTDKVYSLTGLTSSQAPSLANLTAWLSAFTAADLTKQQLTSYDYDWRGQLSKVSEFTSVNSTGAGVGTANTKGYIYDWRGRLLVETTARGVATTSVENDFSKIYTYDGLGRVLTVKDATDNTTTYVYNDATQKQTVTYANGLVETTTFDKTGRVTSVIRTDNLSTTLSKETYLYDAQGRLGLIQDAYGQIESRIYDAAGRIGAVVDKNGYLTRYHYDRAGRVISETKYSASISRSGGWYVNSTVAITLDALELQLAKSHSVDTGRRTTQFVYDAAGNKRYEIDGEGWVTKFTYDKSGHLVSTQRRTTQVDEKYRSEPYYWNAATSINNWWIYDTQQPGSISLVDDTTLGTKVMQLAGTGMYTGFQLSGDANKASLADQLHSVLQLQMDYPTSGWTIYVDVQTSLGQRYVQYTPGTADPQITNTNYLRFSLDSTLFGKGWLTVTRDLLADIQTLEPSNNLLEIKGVLIRGSGKIATVQGQGVTLSALDALGGTYQTISTQTYTATGQLDTITDGEGFKTQFTYDKTGQKIAERRFATANSLINSAADQVSYWLYDAAGQVTAQIEANGALTTYSYSSEGLLLSSTQYETAVRNYVLGSALTLPSGTSLTTTFSYDANGRMIRQTSADGLSTVLKYDSMGNIIERWRGTLIAESAAIPVYTTGTTWSVERTKYDLLNQATATLDANSNAALGAAAASTAIDNEFATKPTSKMVYDKQGRVTDIFDALGNRTMLFYDVAGRLRVKVDALGQVTQYVHNVFNEPAQEVTYNKPLSATDLAAIIAEKSSSATGHLWLNTNKIYIAINAAEFKVGLKLVSTGYNRSGQRTYVTDESGVTTSFTYNALSALIKTTVSAETSWNSVSQTYNTATLATDLTVDGRGLLTSTKVSSGSLLSTTSQTLDAFARIVTSTDALGKVSTFDYTLPGGVAATVGQVTQMSMPVTPVVGATATSRASRVDYDVFGRQLTTTDAQGAVTTYSYNAATRTVTQTTADGISTITTRDVLGRVILVEVKQGATSLQKQSFEYDNNGNLLKTYRYDGATALLVSSATYTKTNQVETQTDASGLTVSMTYDVIGRQLTSSYLRDTNDTTSTAATKTVVSSTIYRERYVETIDGTTKTNMGFEVEQQNAAGTKVSLYDSKGRVVSVRQQETAADGSIRYLATDYVYGRTGGLLTTIQGVVYTLSADKIWSAANYSNAIAVRNEYDGLQRLVKQTQLDMTGGSLKTAPAIKATTFAYDNANRLIETIQNSGGAVYQRELLTYNEAGEVELRIQVADSLGTSGKGRVIVTSYQYDKNGRVVATNTLKDYVTLSVAATSTAPVYATVVSEVKAAYAAALKVTSYAAYDNMGRVIATIDATSRVSYVRYDALGRVSEQIQSATLATSTTISSAIAGTLSVPASTAADGRVTYVYNTRGERAYALTSTGTTAQVVAYSYDNAGRLVSSKAFAAEVSYSTTYTTTSLATAINAALTAKSLTDTANALTQYVYNQAGQLRFTIDALGYVTEQQYDDAGRATVSIRRSAKVTGAQTYASLKTTFAPNVLAALDQRTETVYDSVGRVQFVVDALRQVTELRYNELGQVIAQQRYATTLGAATAATAANLLPLRSSADVITRSFYDAAGRVIFTVAPDNSVHEIRYDALGRVSAELDYFNKANSSVTWTSTYLSSLQSSSDRSTSRVYDAAGRVIEQYSPKLTGVMVNGAVVDGYAKQKFTYNAQGLVETVERGFVKLITDTAFIGPTSVTKTIYDAAGRVSESYGPQLSAITITNADGTTEQVAGYSKQVYSYDAFGRVKDIEQGVVKTLATGFYGVTRKSSTTYDAAGRVSATYGPLTSVTVTKADGSTENISGYSKQAYSYDAFGNVITTEQGVSTTSNGAFYGITRKTQAVYDVLGRTRFVVAPDNSINETRYDEFGNVKNTIAYSKALVAGTALTEAGLSALQQASLDRVSTFAYDVLNRVKTSYGSLTSVTVTKADGTTEQVNGYSKQDYNYDVFGNVTTSDQGVTTSINGAFYGITRKTLTVYDSLGRTRFVVAPDNSINETRYDEFGNVKNTIAYSKAFVAGTALTEAGLSGLQQASLDRVTTFTYDALGRVTNEYSPELRGAEKQGVMKNGVYESINGFVRKKNTYDAFGNLASTEIGAVKLLTDSAFYGDTRVTSYLYDAQGRQIVEVAPNRNVIETRYTVFGERSAEVRYDAALGVATSLTIANVQALANGNERITQYRYDAAGRVVAQYSPQIKDAEKVMVWMGASYVASTGYGLKKFTYDTFGNLVTLEEGFITSTNSVDFVTGGGGSQQRKTSFEYDAMGRQTKVTQGSATNAPDTWSETRYDIFGQAVANFIYTGTEAAKELREARYKVYTAAGQVAYDVEVSEFVAATGQPAKGLVTAYSYNSSGQQTKLTRFANSLTLNNMGTGAAPRVIGQSDLTIVADAANDRSVETFYDVMGRKSKVLESARSYSVVVTDANGNPVVKTSSDRPETRYQYTVFGELFSESVMVSKANATAGTTDIALTTYYWYDALGNQTHVLDAGGYLTTTEYSSFGEAIVRTEFAKALSTSPTLLIKPTPVTADATSPNRVVKYTFDVLGRVIKESRESVQLSMIDAPVTIDKTMAYNSQGQVSSQTTADGTTLFEYDALGNLIKTTGPEVQTVSDVAALNASTTLASQLTLQKRVSTKKYDIFGNVVESRQRAGAVDDDAKDIVQRFTYNSRGQAIELTQSFQASLSGGEAIAPLEKKTTTEYDYKGREIRTSTKFSEQTYARVLRTSGNVRWYYQGGSTSVPSGDLYFLNIDLITGKVSGTKPNTGIFENMQITVIKADGSLLTVPFAFPTNTSAGAAFEVVIDALKLNGTVNSTDTRIDQMYVYDSLGRQTETVTAKYKGNSTKTLQELESTAAALIERVEFNSFGEIISKTSVVKGGSLVTQSKASLTDSATSPEQFFYNSSGLMTSTNQNDMVWKNTYYDLTGRVVAQQHAQNGTTKFLLDALGRQTKVAQAGTATADNISVSTFDRWGNVIQLIDPLGGTYNYRYNEFNQVIQEIKSNVWVVSGSLVGSNTNVVTQLGYDKQGRQRWVLDGNKNISFKQYNADGQLQYDTQGVATNGASLATNIANFESSATKTWYGYDSFGRKVAQQDVTKTIDYSVLNSLGLALETGKRVTDLTLKTVKQTYQYNALGERISSTDSSGQNTYYTYDGRGNISTSLSAANLFKEFAYDAKGRLILEVSGNNGMGGAKTAQRWNYGVDGINTYTVENNAGTVTYKSITTLKQSSLTLNNATQSIATSRGGSTYQVVDYLWNDTTSTLSTTTTKKQVFDYYSNGLLKSVTDAQGNTSVYEYNKAGARTVETHRVKDFNGVIVTQQILTDYDAQGRVTRIRGYDINPSNVKRLMTLLTYQYDAVGNRAAITVGNGLVDTLPETMSMTVGWYPGTAYSEGHFYRLNMSVSGVDAATVSYRVAAGTLPPGLMLDSNTGEITGTIAYNAVSAAEGVKDFNFTIEVTHLLTNEKLTTSSAIKVSHLDSPMALSNDWAADKLWIEGDSVEQAIIGSSNYPSAFAFQITSGALPKGLTLDPNTGAIRGTIAADSVIAAGDYSRTQTFSFAVQFKVVATGEILQKTFTMNVKNRPTSWASQNLVLPTINANKRVTLPSVSLGAYNKGPDGNTVAIRVLSPSWLQYSAATNSLTGYPPEMGNFTYTLEIDDGVNGKLQRTGVLNVAATYTGADNRAPMVLATNAVFGQYRRTIYDTGFDKLGNPLPPFVPAVQIIFDPTTVFTDDNGDALSVSITNIPAGLMLEKISDTSYSLTQIMVGGSVYPDFDQLLNVVVNDGRGGSAQTQVRFLVTTVGDGGGTAEIMVAEPSVDTLMLSDDGTTDFGLVQTYMAAPQPEDTTIDPDSYLPTDALLKTYWFAYDANNRVIIDGASQQNGGLTTVSQGTKIFYNSAGQQEYVVNSSAGTASKYVYNQLNQVVEVYQAGNVTKEQLESAVNGATLGSSWYLLSKMVYDAQGRVEEQFSYSIKEPTLIYIIPRDVDFTEGQRSALSGKQIKLDIRGSVMGHTKNFYNADGQLTQVVQNGVTEEDLFRNATAYFNSTYEFPYYNNLVAGSVVNVSQYFSNIADLKLQSRTFNSAPNEAGMFTYMTLESIDSETLTTTRNFQRTYQLRDQWVETKVEGNGTATSGSISPGSTSSIYNTNGQRIEINEINDQTPDETTTRRMLYAADGTLIKKLEGKKVKQSKEDFNKGAGTFTQQSYSYHFSSNGNYLGEIAEAKKVGGELKGKLSNTLKNQHFSTPDLTSGTPNSNYQVRSGDTLKTIALMFYGNADYWYLIANTNGLTSDPTAALVAGMSLDIPARATVENTGTSFKPMQLEQIIGDTTPNLPYIPPPPKCNAIAMIVMIAVTAFVSFYVPGLVGGPAFISGFIGGFAGSVAGQVTGKALGVVETFSLRSALVSGITQGFAQGMAEKLKTFEWAQKIKLIADTGKLTVGGKMVMAAASVGVNWAANQLVGNNSVAFSWRNVVTSAAAAGVIHSVGEINIGKAGAETTLGDAFDSFIDDNKLLGGTAQGFLSAATSWGVKRGIYGSRYKDDHWNFKQMAMDAFGNALGSSIAVKFDSSTGTESAKQAEQKGQDAYDKAKSEGKSEIEAQQARREAVLSEIPDEKRKQLEIKNDSDKVRIKFIGETNWIDEKDNTARSLSMSFNTKNFDSQNKELIRFITDEGLWRDKKMVDLATYAMGRVEDYWSQENRDRRANEATEEAAARGEARYNHINRNTIAAQQRQRETAQKLDAMNKRTWEAEQARAKMTTLEKTQLVLDVIGTTDAPILSQLAELGSAGISAYQGDYVGAALSIGSMAPGLGKLAEVQKMARWAEKLTPVAKTINAVEKVATVVKESRIAAKLDDAATKVIDFSKSLDEMPRNMDVADLSRVPNPEFRGECFVSGTLIHTKAGMLPIEQIQVGDWVYARHEKTFELSFKKVLQLFNVANKIVHSLVIKSNGVTETITATDEHPIYVQGLGWTPTKSLEPGSVIELIDGSVGVLIENHRHATLETAYNFEVAEFHTYFVGAAGVWVHNSSVMNFSDLRKEELPVKQRVEMYRDAKDTKTISSEYGIAGRDVLVQALGKVGALAKINTTTSLSEAKKLVREYKEMLRIVERTENRFVAGATEFDKLTDRQQKVADRISWLKKVFEGSLRDKIFKDEFQKAKVLGKFGDFVETPQGAKGIDIFRVSNGKSSGQIGLDLTTQASWAKHVTRYKAEHKILLPLFYR